MYISLKWLKEYINLEGISSNEIIEKLTSSGAEVEGIIDKNTEFDNIVVGLVKSVYKHPNADRLSLCKVDDGKEIYSVVCGAPNVEVGQKVAFAKVGAIIPKGKFEIKKTKIRGESSSGMICAEDELGLSEDHSGIMVLENDLEIGQPLAKALNLDDVILDIAITPNRADALSHIGIARDLSAILGRKVNYPILPDFTNISKKNDYAEIEIENSSDCPRYSAVIVKDIKIGESPDWLKDKLTTIGLRPVNNIVDVTNFVLHETGQPLHAFDLNQLGKSRIVVKNYMHNFTFVTLDSKERSMLPTDLMIFDGERPVAIAGVMGGENSEVTEKTVDILIESAYFNPSSIRKTSKRLTLSTDASYRFERGTDPNGTLKAALRAADLIVGIAGGKIIQDVIDVYPKKVEEKKVTLRYARIAKILGYIIENKIINQIIEDLEFRIVGGDKNEILVQIPTFRHDIEREIDLIEEVVRIHGFEKIPNINKINIVLDKKIDQTEFNDIIGQKLTAIGLNETVSNSLLNPEKTIYYNDSIKVLNPQTSEMSLLRASLIPGMLQNISRNLKVKENNLKLFEIGQIFLKRSEDIRDFNDLIEQKHLIIALCGYQNNDQWFKKESKFDFFDLSGLVNSFFKGLDFSPRSRNEYQHEETEIFEYGFERKIDDFVIGNGGKVKQQLLERFQIDNDVFLFEANLSKIEDFYKKDVKFEALLKFPKVYRDFGFILDKNITYEEVMQVIWESGSNLLKNVNLFDIFESESLGSDKKSLAFQLEYYDDSRTLREDEIDKEFWNTIEKVKINLKGELRG